MRERRAAGPSAALALVAVASCGPMAGSGRTDREVLVSAAASLADAFAAMETAFEAAHPGVDVVVNVAGSSALREQLLEGAPADVFAPAGTDDMRRVTAAGLVTGEPAVFARNRLQIAVPPGNPGGVTGAGDFADDDLLIGLCAPQVPCGALGRRALAAAGVTPAPDTDEPDVRSLVTKIAAGELDAGIVYASDVETSDGSVEGIDVPEVASVTADYPIAVLDGAGDPATAADFVEFVTSEAGRAILRDRGFATP